MKHENFLNSMVAATYLRHRLNKKAEVTFDNPEAFARAALPLLPKERSEEIEHLRNTYPVEYALKAQLVPAIFSASVPVAAVAGARWATRKGLDALLRKAPDAQKALAATRLQNVGAGDFFPGGGADAAISEFHNTAPFKDKLIYWLNRAKPMSARELAGYGKSRQLVNQLSARKELAGGGASTLKAGYDKKFSQILPDILERNSQAGYDNLPALKRGFANTKQMLKDPYVWLASWLGSYGSEPVRDRIKLKNENQMINEDTGRRINAQDAR